MGNEGGSIPKRSEVVRTKKIQKNIERVQKARAHAQLCALSKEPLRKPLVICRRGLIYNKESLIKRLIEKNVPTEFRHIRKLSKDTRPVTMDEEQVKQDDKNETNFTLTCALSSTLFSGLAQFYVAWGCGCVLSKQAITELKESAE